MANIDAKLMALDPESGKPCAGFGKDGIVDLNTGMGETPPGFYVPTTGPILAGTRIRVGGWIADNHAVGEPSGVVRAFDVHTGALAWAWTWASPATAVFPSPASATPAARPACGADGV